MSKKGYSRPGLFGTMKHYDADGNFIGESRPGWLGSMENYDANGNKTGEVVQAGLEVWKIMMLMETK